MILRISCSSFNQLKIYFFDGKQRNLALNLLKINTLEMLSPKSFFTLKKYKKTVWDCEILIITFYVPYKVQSMFQYSYYI